MYSRSKHRHIIIMYFCSILCNSLIIISKYRDASIAVVDYLSGAEDEYSI